MWEIIVGILIANTVYRWRRSRHVGKCSAASRLGRDVRSPGWFARWKPLALVALAVLMAPTVLDTLGLGAFAGLGGHVNGAAVRLPKPDAPLPKAWALATQASLPVYQTSAAQSWLRPAQGKTPVCTALWTGRLIITDEHCGAVGVPMRGARPAVAVMGWPAAAVGPGNTHPHKLTAVDVQALVLPPGNAAPVSVGWRELPLCRGEQVVAVCRAPESRWFTGIVLGARQGLVRASNPLRVEMGGCSGAPVLDQAGQMAGLVVGVSADGADVFLEPAQGIADALRGHGIDPERGSDVLTGWNLKGR